MYNEAFLLGSKAIGDEHARKEAYQMFNDFCDYTLHNGFTEFNTDQLLQDRPALPEPPGYRVRQSADPAACGCFRRVAMARNGAALLAFRRPAQRERTRAPTTM